ncbi:MAG TPA: hypothetical protein PK225_14655, partial [Azonexus sp.]|nr:hypothetical protein [Azonexus sp.]
MNLGHHQKFTATQGFCLLCTNFLQQFKSLILLVTLQPDAISRGPTREPIQDIPPSSISVSNSKREFRVVNSFYQFFD